jgi:xylose dehydrogenase (NAD/NADP)
VTFQQYLDDFERREWETETVDGTVRLAVVGLGEFARTQALPGIADADYCETTTLVTGSPETGAETAERFDADHVLSYEEYADGESSDAYDAVYVATPTGRHLGHAETAADLGKAVITEKPMETSVERAERLRDACEEADVTLMVAYRPRTEPALLRARELVREGVLGDVTHVEATFAFRVLGIGGPDQWRIDPDLAGGGALMDAGVYTTTASRFFVESDPESVTATTVSEGDAFEGVDERTTYDVRFADGTTASLTTSFADYYDDRIVVRGTEGTLTIEPAFWFNVAREMTIERDDGEVAVTGPNTDEVREEFDHFGYCVQTGADPLPGAEVGIRDLELTEAVYEAAASDERVSL